MIADASGVDSLAEQLLAEAREELVRADSKAAMLLAAFGVLVGVVVAGLIADDFEPGQLAGGGQALWWTGCGAVALALFALARAIYPTLDHGEAAGPISYFGHAASKESAAAVEKALHDQVQGDRSRTVEQLKVISDIAWRKYRCLQVALWAFGTGAVLCILGPIVG